MIISVCRHRVTVLMIEWACFILKGTRFRYTTYGYTLLSAIVEGASGMNFLQYMKEHIFKPLGMTATVPELNDVLIANRARLEITVIICFWTCT